MYFKADQSVTSLINLMKKKKLLDPIWVVLPELAPFGRSFESLATIPLDFRIEYACATCVSSHLNRIDSQACMLVII
jgi:hypothetical protein